MGYTSFEKRQVFGGVSIEVRRATSCEKENRRRQAEWGGLLGRPIYRAPVYGYMRSRESGGRGHLEEGRPVRLGVGGLG